MFDRPRLSDEAILAALRDGYGVAATRVEFLGLGNDANAWTFRAWIDPETAREGLFLKIRRSIDPARLALAAHLFEHGIPEVIAPVRALNGRRSVDLDDLMLIAYPFVDGVPGIAAGLTDLEWIAYGSFLRRLHDSEPPPEIAAALPREDFVPKATNAIRKFDELFRGAPVSNRADSVHQSVEDLWRARSGDIAQLAEGADALGATLRERDLGAGDSPAVVVCHADVHTHNVLVTPAGGLRVIDWDDAMLAPPERDLMFIVGSTMGLPIGERELHLFAEGYGPLEVDPLTLAFYRFDWVVQDIARYAREALDASASPPSRERALEIFRAQFEPGADVEAVLAADPRIG
jgi:spectinomycin phosphotransferase